MNLSIWIDGQQQERISVQDRAFQYGDGFFTTILAAQGKLYNWPAHWWRLSESARRLGFGDLNEALLLGHLRQALAVADPQIPLALKLIVSRGEGGQGYLPPLNAIPRVIVQVSSHPCFTELAQLSHPVSPVTLTLCQTRCAIQPQLAGLKHLNRLENVLARAELHTLGFDEGVMLNPHNEVVCATQSNLFLVDKGRLMTPELSLSGVAGTTRYQLRSLAEKMGLQWEEGPLRLEQLHQADEVFLTNALRGVQPVACFEGTTYSMETVSSLHLHWVEWQNTHALQVVT